jgi:flagellar biosynthetic protein FliQ
MTFTLPEALSLAREALVLALTLTMPVLLVGMAVGLVISLLQAVTQIQEQTLSFVPKMIVMGIAVMLFLPWLSTQVLDFSRRMFGSVLLGE